MKHWSEEREVFIRVRKALSEGTIDGEIISAFPVTLETASSLITLAKEFQPVTAEEYKSEMRWIIETFGRMAKGLAPMLNLLNEVTVALESLERKKESIETLRRTIVEIINRFSSRVEGALERTARNCAEQFMERERVFVYSCSRTVIAAIIKARDMGKEIEVVVTESRPWCEGLNTVKALDRKAIQIILGIDAALNPLLKGCTSVLVGAESISYKGDVLCKIGTYPLAIIAREQKIPVKIAADLPKFDVTIPHLKWPVYGSEGPESDLLKNNKFLNVKVRNIMAEVAPSQLITEIVTEKGVIFPKDVTDIMKSLPVSKSFIEAVLCK